MMKLTLYNGRFGYSLTIEDRGEKEVYCVSERNGLERQAFFSYLQYIPEKERTCKKGEEKIFIIK